FRRSSLLLFFFQAEDGIRDFHVTGVQTCALPICSGAAPRGWKPGRSYSPSRRPTLADRAARLTVRRVRSGCTAGVTKLMGRREEIGRASCRERVWMSEEAGAGDKSRREGGVRHSV